jgi:hypothetical protein
LEALQNARRFDWLDCDTKYLIKGLSETRVVIENKLDKLAAEEQHAKTREVIVQALRQYMVEETKRPKRTHKRRDFDMMKEENLLVADDADYNTRAEEQVHLTFEESRKLDRERKFRDGEISIERRRIQCEVESRRAIMASLSFLPWRADTQLYRTLTTARLTGYMRRTCHQILLGAVFSTGLPKVQEFTGATGKRGLESRR